MRSIINVIDREASNYSGFSEFLDLLDSQGEQFLEEKTIEDISKLDIDQLILNTLDSINSNTLAPHLQRIMDSLDTIQVTDIDYI